ncbi:uncharacterized protein LOC142164326 [Nicotiana tabacum]|uniref:Uncharacterized protein LOC142164326 n=1 Tax=Nicotiana tabacum TaxID=4097 RepID=A0AC58S0M8_TOBAC
MKTILCEGPYTVNNRPMIMKQWSSQFDFDAEFLTEIPLWVRFPKLPMNCWGGTSLSRIASTIGIPLLDECTAKQTRISHARILIEVNVTKPPPSKVPIMDDSGYDCTKIRKEEVKQIQQPKRIGPQPMKQVWKTTRVVEAEPNPEEGQQQNLDKGKGTNKQYKQKELGTYIRENNTKLVGLVETRVKKDKADGIANRVVLWWKARFNYDHAVNGRVWLLWDPSYYDVSIIDQSAQAIYCDVRGRMNQLNCVMTVIYRFNTIELRKPLWVQLHNLTTEITKPWLIWGDFNSVLTIEDRLYGNLVTSNEIQDFANYRFFCRIDRAIGNDVWMNTFGHMEVDYKIPFISEHAPMMITLRKAESNGKIPFKFFNVWAYHEDFLTVVEGVWQTQLQGYTDADALEEKKLLEKLERWSLIEESILQQKSRAKWIKLGDSNTKYFSVNAELTNAFGDRLTYQKQILAKIISFYKSFMGSRSVHLPAINKEIMKMGYVLAHSQQVNLCAEVTEQEIFEALNAIGDDKAPGVDGYNALFFKRSLKLIRPEVCQAVKNFFHTSKLYRAINCTAITLIPKVLHPTSIKEYIPIPCCTVLYKLIVKILANRLQKVIASVFSDTQAGFIPGRKVADNVLLAHELVKAYSRKNISPKCLIKVDIQKTYDINDWRYLHQVLECLGFPLQFTNWIIECVSTVNYTILINGETTKTFDAARVSLSNRSG